MVFSRWHSVSGFLNSDALRKEVSYRVQLDKYCTFRFSSLKDAEDFLRRSLDKFGFSPKAEIRLCFNGAPVRGRILCYPYGWNRRGFLQVESPEVRREIETAIQLELPL